MSNIGKFFVKVRKHLAVAVLCVAASNAARAQWMTQRIDLKAGWNAVHLKVHPADRSCANVFPAAVTKVSWWNRDRIDDGTGSAITDFCSWYRGEPSTFSNVIGDHCYLVYSTAPQQVDVIGRPALPRGTIYRGEANLVGLNVPVNAGEDAPSYLDYFKDCKPLWNSNKPWSAVGTDGEPQAVVNAGTLLTNASEAVWFDTAGLGMETFTGPFTVTHDMSSPAIEWTDNTEVRTITVVNKSTDDRRLVIERFSSMEPPTGENRSVGIVQLLLEDIDWSAGYAKRVYNPVSFPFATNIAAGAVFEFRVKPDLDSMSATDAGDYMSVLQISDKGTTIEGHTFDKGTCLYSVGLSCAGNLSSRAVAKSAGLWIGTVVLAQVNRAKMLGSSNPEWDADALMTAPHPFQFRLLLHVDENGKAKILKEVFTAKADAASDTMLLADRRTAIAFRGEYPNGTIRRTSSANFPFMAPLALTGGTFMKPDDTITGTLTQAYDDKTNPFVHAFHPQHDNIEFNNQKPSKLDNGDEGVGEYESWSVARKISLTFLESDPSSAAGEEWNRSVTGGLYDETVTGLIGQGKPIKTRGIFRLTKVNDVKSLHSDGVLD